MDLRAAIVAGVRAPSDAHPPIGFAPIARDILHTQRQVARRLGPCAPFLFRSDLRSMRPLNDGRFALEFVLSKLSRQERFLRGELRRSFPEPRVVLIRTRGVQWTAARRFVCRRDLARDLRTLAAFVAFWPMLRIRRRQGVPASAIWAQYVSLRRRLLHPSCLQTFLGSQLGSADAHHVDA